MKFWLYLILFSFTSSSLLLAEEIQHVRFSLIHAQDDGIEERLPVQDELKRSLEKLFGYKKYRIIGQARSSLRPQAPVMFSPHDMFSMRFSKVTSQPAMFEFELLQENKPLLKGQYHPKPQVPLIIRGPFYDRGNLILVIRSEAQ
ncbi:MAG: hypothetical protein AAF558_13120 [Verrucomicrobiota bacterium]